MNEWYFLVWFTLSVKNSNPFVFMRKQLMTCINRLYIYTRGVTVHVFVPNNYSIFPPGNTNNKLRFDSL